MGNTEFEITLESMDLVWNCKVILACLGRNLHYVQVVCPFSKFWLDGNERYEVIYINKYIWKWRCVEVYTCINVWCTEWFLRGAATPIYSFSPFPPSLRLLDLFLCHFISQICLYVCLLSLSVSLTILIFDWVIKGRLN